MTKTTEPQPTKNLPQQSSISNSNSTHSSSCCSSSSPLSSLNIQFQQQCQKDPYFQNPTIKFQPKRKRNPLTDCTNTTSSSVPPKSTKFKYLFSSQDLSTNDASNPSSSPSLSTPPLPKKLPTPAYGRRYSSNKRNDKEKEVDIPTSSVPSKRKDKDMVNLANSKPKLTSRTPFFDCTNTSSSVPLKSTKYKPPYSSPVFKNLSTKLTSTTDAVNLDDAPNPSSSPSTFLSTPLPKKSSNPEIVDLEASEPISIVYGRRYSSNKRKDKEKEVVFPTSSSVPINPNSEPIKMKDKAKDTVISTSSMCMDTWKEVVIPGSSKSIKRKDKEMEVVNLANSAPIKRKDKGKDTVISESSNFMDTWEEAVISESRASIKRKDKRKECDIPSSTTPILKVSNTREKSDGLERAKAKAFSAPCTKKHCARSSKKDYIKKQNAYFKLIDEFELSEDDADSMSDS